MKKLLITAISLALLTTVTHAQQTPVGEVALGYSSLAVKSAGLTAYGGSASIALNANSWLGAVGDFALYHASPVAQTVAAGTLTCGPRFLYRHWDRLTPFAQVLLGGLRYTDSALAFGAGGGADLKLDGNGRFALRPQFEYFGFRIDGNTVNTVRVSTGLVFRFGKKSNQPVLAQ